MTRGEVWWADFGVPFGSETGFRRPVVVVQNDIFNRSAIGTVLVTPLTTNMILADAPGNVTVSKSESGLVKDSVLVVSQTAAIDRRRLHSRVRRLSKPIMDEVNRGLSLVLGLTIFPGQ
jgi:mRNA interferase MazF